MKNSNPRGAGRSSEFKGVVKKITGKLTGDVNLEREGREEMLKTSEPKPVTARIKNGKPSSSDPHRRG